jgi:hypothetical protein
LTPIARTSEADAPRPLRHETSNFRKEPAMNNLLRGGLAGLAAWKLGGGIIGTILIFLLVFWLLGMF